MSDLQGVAEAAIRVPLRSMPAPRVAICAEPGDGRSLSSDRPDKAASYKCSVPGLVPLCIAAPGSIACDLDHKGSQIVLSVASR